MLVGLSVIRQDRTYLKTGELMAMPLLYEIRVVGHLDPSWSEWLYGMTISQETGDVTLLSGPIRDQAALFGLLVKLRDMGLNLISVNRVEIPENNSKPGR